MQVLTQEHPYSTLKGRLRHRHCLHSSTDEEMLQKIINGLKLQYRKEMKTTRG
jgi:hypothetical protein